MRVLEIVGDMARACFKYHMLRPSCRLVEDQLPSTPCTSHSANHILYMHSTCVMSHVLPWERFGWQRLDLCVVAPCLHAGHAHFLHASWQVI